MEVTFEDRTAQPTLSIRTRAAVQDMPGVFGDAFEAVMQYLGQMGEQPAAMPYAVYRNMDMQDLDLEIGFPVARPLPGEGRIQPGEIPGGRWATVMHVGPYDQIGASWGRLTAGIAAAGMTIAGPAYEFYFDGPETPPEKIRTLLGHPVA
ncbi:MAG TPA: AraC family transcriptional regulator [Actinobacteria bacterium]|nr:AraC family transcriptional regulator [Actinomycetota bacterium]